VRRAALVYIALVLWEVALLAVEPVPAAWSFALLGVLFVNIVWRDVELGRQAGRPHPVRETVISLAIVSVGIGVLLAANELIGPWAPWVLTVALLLVSSDHVRSRRRRSRAQERRAA
jgi:hypothetical protein